MCNYLDDRFVYAPDHCEARGGCTLIFAMIAEGILVLGLLIAAMIVHRRTKFPPNYRIVFLVGIAWLPMGIATENRFFIVMDRVLEILGLPNKKKWCIQPSWNESPPDGRTLNRICESTYCSLDRGVDPHDNCVELIVKNR